MKNIFFLKKFYLFFKKYNFSIEIVICYTHITVLYYCLIGFWIFKSDSELYLFHIIYLKFMIKYFF